MFLIPFHCLELQKTLQHLLCSVPAFQIRKFEHVWRQTLSLLPAMRVLPLVLPIWPNLPARRCSVLLPQQSCLLPVWGWGGEAIGATLVVRCKFFLECFSSLQQSQNFVHWHIQESLVVLVIDAAMWSCASLYIDQFSNLERRILKSWINRSEIFVYTFTQFCAHINNRFTNMVKDILQKILGVPYFWGGSSAKNEEFSKSADDAAAMQCNAVLPVCGVIQVCKNSHHHTLQSHSILA